MVFHSTSTWLLYHYSLYHYSLFHYSLYHYQSKRQSIYHLLTFFCLRECHSLHLRSRILCSSNETAQLNGKCFIALWVSSPTTKLQLFYLDPWSWYYKCYKNVFVLIVFLSIVIQYQSKVHLVNTWFFQFQQCFIYNRFQVGIKNYTRTKKMIKVFLILLQHGLFEVATFCFDDLSARGIRWTSFIRKSADIAFQLSCSNFHRCRALMGCFAFILLSSSPHTSCMGLRSGDCGGQVMILSWPAFYFCSR